MQFSTLKTTCILALLSSVALTTGAHAERLGFVGLQAAYGDGKNPNDNDHFDTGIFTLEGAYGYRFNDHHMLVIEGLYRGGHYDSDLTDDEDARDQWQLGLHYLYSIDPSLMVGGFLGYGEAPFDDSNERYKVSFGGLQGIYNVRSDVTAFAQLGLVDSPNGDNMSSAGYMDGYVMRVGTTYSGYENTAITFDVEVGSSDEYEDSDEPGSFVSVHLGGRTALRGRPDWSFTYGLRWAEYIAKTDGDYIREKTAYVGFEYAFGGATAKNRAKSGLIGLPYLPLRATGWTPAMD